ncbi:hypothetical protein FRB91_006031 [Serendipita sp. 411]|nr:hypothetical protein FRC16_010876 [Serendipita sp. 398]KAG8852750.1 hypothetical protein FRB91_006031 [Serendipita sp. 411]KAG8856664.1 hypothetical protein FRC20_000431 [Serendipita sp. 405]KAG9052035.1 hypothetical protein FS842_010595 [Serendipita sp. 407]
MSKSPPAEPKPTVTHKHGDVVLAKVKGYSAWPAVVIDPEDAPPSVKAEKPKGAGFCCVRFMPAGDFGWPTMKDVVALTQKQIETAMEKDKKKSGKLYQGYTIAKDPQAWIAEQEKQRLAQIELEANAEEDQLDGEDDTTEKKTKKRRAAAEPKTTGRRKGGDDSKKKRAVKKRKADDEEEDDSKPSKKKAKKDEEEDPTLLNDPEAVKIKDWRHVLQRAFLRDNVKPEANSLPEYDEVFNTIESYQGMTIQYLSYSKIGKVMKKISQLDDSHIPESDGQFKFRERAGKLVTQWHAILSASGKGADGGDGAATNGTGNAEDASPEAGAAPAEPEAGEGEGDVVMATDA